MAKRIISRAKYLTALALFTMGNKHMAKVDEYLDELCVLLEEDKNGHLADELYGRDGDFDSALKRAGITLSPPKKRRGK